MKNRYTVVKICQNCVFPQGLYRLRDKETGWKIIIEDKKDVDCIKNYLITKDEQIRSLEEQLKNAIVPKFKNNDVAWRIHWYTNEIERVVIVRTEIKIVLDTKIVYLIAVLEEGITLDNLDKKFFNNPDTDLVEESNLFATREEAEKRLDELEGK